MLLLLLPQCPLTVFFPPFFFSYLSQLVAFHFRDESYKKKDVHPARYHLHHLCRTNSLILYLYSAEFAEDLVSASLLVEEHLKMMAKKKRKGAKSLDE